MKQRSNVHKGCFRVCPPNAQLGCRLPSALGAPSRRRRPGLASALPAATTVGLPTKDRAGGETSAHGSDRRTPGAVESAAAASRVGFTPGASGMLASFGAASLVSAPERGGGLLRGQGRRWRRGGRWDGGPWQACPRSNADVLGPLSRRWSHAPDASMPRAAAQAGCQTRRARDQDEEDADNKAPTDDGVIKNQLRRQVRAIRGLDRRTGGRQAGWVCPLPREWTQD